MTNFFISLLPLVAYFSIRGVVTQIMLRMMRSNKRTDLSPLGPTRPQLPPTTPLGELQFLEVDATKGILLNGIYQERFRQLQQVGVRTWWTYYLALGLFIMSAGVIFFLVPLHLPEILQSFSIPMDYLPLAAWGLFLVGSHLGVPVVYSQYRYVGWVPLPTLLGNSLVVGILWLLITVILRIPIYGTLIPPALFLFTLGLGYWSIRRRALHFGNHRLLLLRVFGSDPNAAFLFGALMQRWHFLGSYLTIADPSFLRFESSYFSNKRRGWLLLFYTLTSSWIALVAFVAATLLQLYGWLATESRLATELSTIPRLQLTQAVTFLIWGSVILWLTVLFVRTLHQRFVRDSAALQQTMNRIYDTKPGLTGLYTGQAVYCQDNTWQPTVHSLLRASDGVLMDLRGFNHERRGSEYEIAMIVQHCAVHRVVLLVDAGEQRHEVFAAFQHYWAQLTMRSPNWYLRLPTLKVYTPCGDDPLDVERILALLVAATEQSSDPDGALVHFDGYPQYRSGNPCFPKRSWWSRCSHAVNRLLFWLDMLLTSFPVTVVLALLFFTLGSEYAIRNLWPLVALLLGGSS